MIFDNREFLIDDQADRKDNYGGIQPNGYNIPQGLMIDKKTYLAGSYRFKLKEIEVYKVFK